MSYYQKLYFHIRDKVKVVLDLSNQLLKKESEHATGMDTSKRQFYYFES